MLGVTQAASPTPRCACRELDLRILQEALAKEAAQEEAEAAARAKRAEDVRLYRQQLANMMVKDMEDQGERDAMIQVGIGRPAPFSLKKTSVLAERILRQACTSPKCMHHDDSDGRREPWRAGRHDPGGRGQAFLPYTGFPSLYKKKADTFSRALVCAHLRTSVRTSVCTRLGACFCVCQLMRLRAVVCPSMCLCASMYVPIHVSACKCVFASSCKLGHNTRVSIRLCVWHAHGMHTGCTQDVCVARARDAHRIYAQYAHTGCAHKMSTQDGHTGCTHRIEHSG